MTNCYQLFFPVWVGEEKKFSYNRFSQSVPECIRLYHFIQYNASSLSLLPPKQFIITVKRVPERHKFGILSSWQPISIKCQVPAARYPPWENSLGRKVYFLLQKRTPPTGGVKKEKILPTPQWSYHSNGRYRKIGHFQGYHGSSELLSALFCH